MSFLRVMFSLAIFVTIAHAEVASTTPPFGTDPSTSPVFAGAVPTAFDTVGVTSPSQYDQCTGVAGLNCIANPDPTACQSACQQAIRERSLGFTADLPRPPPTPPAQTNQDFLQFALLMMMMSGDKSATAAPLPQEQYYAPPPAPVYIQEEKEGAFCIGICSDSDGGMMIGIGNTQGGGIGIGGF